jgi:hypothetical protein
MEIGIAQEGDVACRRMVYTVGLTAYSGLPGRKGSMVIGGRYRITKAADIVIRRSSVYAIALIINDTGGEGRVVNKYPIRRLIASRALTGRERILNEVAIYHYPTLDIRAKGNARGCAWI